MLKKIRCSGFCIADAGSLLYSDFTDPYKNRQKALSILQENLPALSTDRLLMVENGSFYAIRYADLIDRLPQAPYKAERAKLYTAVPFVQMILHGTLDYAGVPVNLAEDTIQAQLRSVEFGGCPCYEWCFDKSEKALYFEDQINAAVDFYQKANEALADLREARITGNGDTQTQGVRYTRYDSGAVIYVNYTDAAATVGNIRVGAHAFRRIG